MLFGERGEGEMLLKGKKNGDVVEGKTSGMLLKGWELGGGRRGECFRTKRKGMLVKGKERERRVVVE